MNRSLSRLTLAILAGCCALPVTAQESAATGAQAADKTEVIQVRGIRGSLTQALATKRMSDSVLDSVSAEDIGDFPDKNIGDALQRIPGVTVNRGYGEVEGVNIRGTSPQQSIVLLNGQNVASVGWFDLGGFKRSFNFELVSSEQIAGMDVYKSTDAEVNEGAMGGTINLKTRRPLDMQSNTIFGSIEGSHNANSDGWEPSVSGLYSWKGEDEKFGVLAAYSVEQQDIVRETLSTFSNPMQWNFPGDDYDSDTVVKDTDGNLLTVPIGFASIHFNEERKRESGQLTLQYQATDDLLFTLDYNRFVLANPHLNTALFAFFHHNAVVEADSVVTNSQGVAVAGKVVAGRQDSSRLPMFSNPVIRDPEMKSDILNLTFEYEAESWALDGVIGRSNAESRGMQSSTWWGNQDDKSKTGFSYDISGPLILTPTDPDYVTDHSQQQLYSEFSYLNNVRDNEIKYYQLDHTYHLELGIFTSLQSGIKYQDQFFSAAQHTYDAGLLAKGMADGLKLSDFNGGHVTGLNGKEGRPGTVSGFALLNDSIWGYAEANKGALNIVKQFRVEEEITSAYLKANFEGETYRGNFGLRYVSNDVTSLGTSNGTPNGTPLKGEKSYNELLPSFNLVKDLSDDLLVRFAASSTLSRPDYDQMQMLSDIAEFQQKATVGSPDIDPYTSNQFDVGVEWYFDQTSILSATAFFKDISDYIEQTTEVEDIDGCSACRVTRFRNAGSSEVKGIELNYQQDFGNGFGVQANYTYTDSTLEQASGVSIPMYEVSKNSYNLAAYYENEILSARVAFNSRDEWSFNYNGVLAVADDYQQVDASIVWHVNDRVDLSLEGINLLNEARIGRLPEFGTTHSVDEFGARYFISATYKM
ncbi:TonB-dependent receptor [Bowmanella denitrificans]|uniref:TonB-dependent receptor n=1 Tax=Bowmanella denitrificans TaxID=366582 RepID=UPI000C9A7D15|nr:TonB-dependent receptor [Bowmanella denitrificans]